MIRVPVFSDFFEYAIDATQRSLLFWDTLRERGNEYLRHEAAGKPPLLTFGHEMLLYGRTREKPCISPCCASCPVTATCRPIRRCGPSSWSTHAPDMVPGSAASRRTARSAMR